MIESEKYLIESLKIFDYVLGAEHSMTQTTKEILDNLNFKPETNKFKDITKEEKILFKDTPELIQEKEVLVESKSESNKTLKEISNESKKNKNLKPTLNKIKSESKKEIQFDKKIDLSKNYALKNKIEFNKILNNTKTNEIYLNEFEKDEMLKKNKKTTDIESTKRESNINLNIKSEKIKLDSNSNLLKFNSNNESNLNKLNSPIKNSQETSPIISIDLIDEKSINDANNQKFELKIDTTPIIQTTTNHKTTSPESGLIGVKKKASMKKFSPRARTPLPSSCNQSNILNDSNISFVKNDLKSNNETLKFDLNQHLIKNPIEIIKTNQEKNEILKNLYASTNSDVGNEISVISNLTSESLTPINKQQQKFKHNKKKKK